MCSKYEYGVVYDFLVLVQLSSNSKPNIHDLFDPSHPFSSESRKKSTEGTESLVGFFRGLFINFLQVKI